MVKGGRNFGLDVIRAAAIALVILSHGRACLETSFPFLREFFVFGYLGVEIFFVLSGFLIGGILINVIKPGCSFKDVKNFWVRRWFRTLPNYYLFLLVEILLAALFVKGAILSKFLLYPVFLQTFYYPVRPVYFSVSWSLAVEEWFYLLIPILLLAGVRFLGNIRRSLVLTAGCVLLLLLFLRFFYVFKFNADWGPDIRNTTILRLDSIMFGVIGAYVLSAFPAFWEKIKVPGFFVGITLLLVNVAYLQCVNKDSSLYCRTLQFSIVPLSVLLCFPFLRALPSPDGRGVVAKMAPWIVRISLWSYSLYLCHMIVLRFIAPLMEYLKKKGLPSLLVDLGAFALFIAVSVTIAALTYQFFEKPITALRERFSRREKHSY